MRPSGFRPPIKILGIEIDEENVIIRSDGETRRDALVILAEEDGVDDEGNPYAGIDGIHAGYYCARCYEPQEKPFPKACWLCNFPMSDKQAEFIAKGYRGNIRMGPSSTLEDEYAFMDEWEEEQKRKSRDEILRPSQIWLP